MPDIDFTLDVVRPDGTVLDRIQSVNGKATWDIRATALVDGDLQWCFEDIVVAERIDYFHHTYRDRQREALERLRERETPWTQ